MLRMGRGWERQEERWVEAGGNEKGDEEENDNYGRREEGKRKAGE